MYMEIPLFRTCCCCFPISHGLVAWGFLRSVLTFGALMVTILETEDKVNNYIDNERNGSIEIIALFSVLAVILILDILTQLYFISAVFTKSVKKLKSYHSYSVTILGLWLLASFPTIILLIEDMVGKYTKEAGTYFTLKLFGIFLSFPIQIYMLLILRSTIIKIERDNFSALENSATEDDYTMRNNRN